MKYKSQHPTPTDGTLRQSAQPVICYPVDQLLKPAHTPHANSEKQCIKTLIIAPRTAETFSVPAGHFFRIVSIEGAQVGDLNLWSEDNLQERFYSGKTRALHGTHLSTGDSLWSNFPHLRAMATITDDTLDWYGFDADGASVHDVIGTRCDPYTHHLLTKTHYDFLLSFQFNPRFGSLSGLPIISGRTAYP